MALCLAEGGIPVESALWWRSIVPEYCVQMRCTHERTFPRLGFFPFSTSIVPSCLQSRKLASRCSRSAGGVSVGSILVTSFHPRIFVRGRGWSFVIVGSRG